MEITTQERVKDLKPYKFNQELFDLLKGSDYNALKRDIQKDGVKVEIHILPDKTVICGHQRLRIAKELKISHLRCKTVYNLDTPEKVREYVILDNLLRRQLTPEKQAFLLDDLSKQYETGRGAPKGSFGNVPHEKDNMSSSLEDVNQKTAKKVNVSPKTVQRARAYVKAVKEKPDEYKGKTITVVLQDVKRKKNEKKIQEEAPKLELKGIYKTLVIDPPWEAKANPSGYARPDYTEEWWRVKKIRGYTALGIKIMIDGKIYYTFPTYEFQTKLAMGIIHISKQNDRPQEGQPTNYHPQFEYNFSSLNQYITNINGILKRNYKQSFLPIKRDG